MLAVQVRGMTTCGLTVQIAPHLSYLLRYWIQVQNVAEKPLNSPFKELRKTLEKNAILQG